MSPSHKGLRTAWCFALVASLLAALPARAQILSEDAQRALDLLPDPLARSARLVGMGRLSLVLADVNNRLSMWDFAGNPVGIHEADSMSTFEVRPSFFSTASVQDVATGAGTNERQDLAARHARIGYEAWRRSKNGTVFGGIGTLSDLRVDRPYNALLENRNIYSSPNGMLVLSGKMPVVWTERARYALRFLAESEYDQGEYHLIRGNAQGEYIDLRGDLIDPPNRFDPTESRVRTTSVGGSFSYRLGPWLNAAVGADYLAQRIRSQNEGGRYLTEYEENRPYGVGQVSLIGDLGPSFRWGADARGWRGNSDRTYVVTGSAGIAAIPISGRGDMYDRDEEGSTLRTRFQWTRGAWEVGGSYGTYYRRVETTPPPVTDGDSFNSYLSRLYYDTRADSIALPDSVIANTAQSRALQLGGGVGWHLKRGRVGAEFHWWRDRLDQDAGEGPVRIGWDVRAGYERSLTPVLTARTGYVYRRDDRDDLTEQNEFLSQTATVGFGLRPAGTRWTVEAGYALEWGQADWGTPAKPRFTRQQLATQIHLGF